MELILAVALIVALWLLRGHGQRIASLEREVATLRAAPEAVPTVVANALEPADEEAMARDEEAVPDDEPVIAGPWQQAAERAEQSDPVESEAAPAAKKRPDIETALGTRWAVWVGGLALALGGVFLVRYSIEAGFFGPQMRLATAALFGIALAAAGEWARRGGFRTPVGGLDAAYVPAILTGAAAFTLFATIFSAYAVYGFVGPGTAFAMLAAIALATLGSAFLHGQALGGLGLLGSYVTPGLVATSAPNPWMFFAYLALVLVATLAVASVRRWHFLAAAAYVGAGLWGIVYLFGADPALPMPVTLMHLTGICALAGIWLARPGDGERSRVDPASLAASLFGALTAILILPVWQPAQDYAGLCAALLIAGMLAAASLRGSAIPLLHAAGAATVVIAGRMLLSGRFDIDIYGGRIFVDGGWTQLTADLFMPFSYGLALLFFGVGIAFSHRFAGSSPRRAAQWAWWAAAVPLSVVAFAWLVRGNLDVDWRFAAPAFALMAALAAGGEWVARSERLPFGGWAVSILLAGSGLAFCLGLVAGFDPFWTTMMTGLAAALPAAATRLRLYRVLGWVAAGLAAVTLVRVAMDPTLVGVEELGTRPFLNALLPGYFVPSAAFAFAAWQLARTTAGRPRHLMEAFAALFALVGAGMLVRHAMHGGVIDAGMPTLAEQAIYSLIVIGAGVILLLLDGRSPSPVFRWGSIAAGVVSVVFMAFEHLLDLNPLRTNESTGAIPVLNLLLLAYLMPAAALATLAWLARGRRPDWYVSMLATGAAVLAFVYVSLSVRRVFHGEFIGAWKGFGAVETYTYSAVWLVIGVGVLAAGLRLGSRVLRLGSGVLVVVAVAKVFLWDMRELEGVLRALSFIGLGGVLICIGMFYQRMLARSAGQARSV